MARSAQKGKRSACLQGTRVYRLSNQSDQAKQGLFKYLTLTPQVTLNSDAILPGDHWVSTSSIRRTPSGKMRSTDEFRDSTQVLGVIMGKQQHESVVNVLATQSCLTLCDPMNCSLLVPLSMGFLRQEYWSWQLFPSPEDLPNPEIKPGSPTWQADSLLSEPPGKP